MASGTDLDPVLAEYGDLTDALRAAARLRRGHRLEQSLTGLGLPRLDRERPVATLSGGQRSRLHLAALLAAGPEVLLLDEPTNHLDAQAARWLEQHVTRPGTTVVVSHDREFLDAVAGELVEVDRTASAASPATPAGTRTTCRPRRANARGGSRPARSGSLRSTGWPPPATPRPAPVNHARERPDNDKMQYGYKGGRVQESLAARVRANAEKLRRLREAEVPRPPDPLRFVPRPGPPAVAGPSTPRRGWRLAPRRRSTPSRVGPGDRLLVTGPNGSGKSTLFDVLTGALAPDTGTVRRRGRTGLLRQDPAPTGSTGPSWPPSPPAAPAAPTSTPTACSGWACSTASASASPCVAVHGRAAPARPGAPARRPATTSCSSTSRRTTHSAPQLVEEGWSGRDRPFAGGGRRRVSPRPLGSAAFLPRRRAGHWRGMKLSECSSS